MAFTLSHLCVSDRFELGVYPVSMPSPANFKASQLDGFWNFPMRSVAAEGGGRKSGMRTQTLPPRTSHRRHHTLMYADPVVLS